MSQSVVKESSCIQKTRFAVLWSSLLSEPLTSLYSLLPFILYKEMHASAFQVAVFFMVKPVVSIFSLYWSAWVEQRRDRLKANIVWAGILARVSFLFLPFVNNSWLVIVLAALYWMFFRGMIPAWMEVLKLNLPKEKRGRIFSMGAIWGYAEGVLLAIAIGPMMDMNPHSWKWIFPFSALIGIVGVWIQARLPISGSDAVKDDKVVAEGSLKHHVMVPWRNVFKLLLQRPDFMRFQGGIMMCGFAIMLMKPAEPVIFEILGLSYTDLAVAVLILKGLGYISTSALWANWMNKVNIFWFTAFIFLLVGVCYTLFFCALWHVAALFLAYFIYGVWLAGNHLSWNLAGPVFSHHEDSSTFTTIGVALVGIRGLVGPALGSFLLAKSNPYVVLCLGIGLCILSAIKMFQWGQREDIALLISRSK